MGNLDEFVERALLKYGLPRCCPTHGQEAQRVSTVDVVAGRPAVYCEVDYFCGCEATRDWYGVHWAEVWRLGV